MKLSNELLVIDLETTSSLDENGYQVNNDIIQIGAVLLDRDLNVVHRYASLVKPREPVSPFITELTGITDEAAQAARSFDQVITEFFAEISQKVKNTKTVRACA